MEADQSDRGQGSNKHPATGLNPIVVFVVLLVLLLGALGALWLISGGNSGGRTSASGAGPNPDTAPSLTDQQALQRFHELMRLDRRIGRTGDPSLVDSVIAADGPLHRIAIRLLKRMKYSHVADYTKVQTRSLEIVSNTKERIVIRETRDVRPCARDARGEDVTRGPVKARQELKWVLEPSNGKWLLYDSVLEGGRILQRSGRHCLE